MGNAAGKFQRLSNLTLTRAKMLPYVVSFYIDFVLDASNVKTLICSGKTLWGILLVFIMVAPKAITWYFLQSNGMAAQEDFLPVVLQLGPLWELRKNWEKGEFQPDHFWYEASENMGEAPFSGILTAYILTFGNTYNNGYHWTQLGVEWANKTSAFSSAMPTLQSPVTDEQLKAFGRVHIDTDYAHGLGLLGIDELPVTFYFSVLWSFASVAWTAQKINFYAKDPRPTPKEQAREFAWRCPEIALRISSLACFGFLMRRTDWTAPAVALSHEDESIQTALLVWLAMSLIITMSHIWAAQPACPLAIRLFFGTMMMFTAPLRFLSTFDNMTSSYIAYRSAETVALCLLAVNPFSPNPRLGNLVHNAPFLLIIIGVSVVWLLGLSLFESFNFDFQSLFSGDRCQYTRLYAAGTDLEEADQSLEARAVAARRRFLRVIPDGDPIMLGLHVDLDGANLRDPKVMYAVESITDMRRQQTVRSFLQTKGMPVNAQQARECEITVSQLRTAGFRAQHMFDMGFCPQEAREAGFNAAELKEVFHAQYLFDANFTAQEARRVGFDATELKAVGFAVHQLMNAAFDAKDLLHAGFTVTELKRTGFFDARDLKSAGVPDSKLRQAGFDVTELIEAGSDVTSLFTEAAFSASELREAGVMADKFVGLGLNLTDLKEAGYSAGDLKCHFSLLDLKDAGFRALDLKTAGFNTQQLKGVDFSLDMLQEAGFTAEELFHSGFHLEELKDHFTPSDLREAGFSARQLKGVGFTKEVLKDDGKYTSQQLADAGFHGCSIQHLMGQQTAPSAAQLKEQGFSASEVRRVGFNLGCLKEAGFSAQDLKQAGFDARQLKDAGFQAKDMRGAMYSARKLREIGYHAEELLIDGAFSKGELAQAGFREVVASTMLESGATFVELKENGFSAKQLRASGVGLDTLKSIGYSAIEVKDAGFDLNALKAEGYTAQQLKEAGFGLSQLRRVGFHVRDLKQAGYTANELKEGGRAWSWAKPISLKEMKEGGFSAEELRDAGFSAPQLKDAGFEVGELKDASFSAWHLKDAGFCAEALKEANFAAADLRDAGFCATELKEADFSVRDLKMVGFSAEQLYDAHFEVGDLKSVGWTATELREVNFGVITTQQLLDAGFTLKQLKEAGVRPKEFKTTRPVPSIGELRAAGFKHKDLKEAGYPDEDLAPVFSVSSSLTESVSEPVSHRTSS